jgi:hypothetical protein
LKNSRNLGLVWKIFTCQHWNSLLCCIHL